MKKAIGICKGKTDRVILRLKLKNLLVIIYVRLTCFCPLAVPLYSFGTKNTPSRHLSRSLSAC